MQQDNLTSEEGKNMAKISREKVFGVIDQELSERRKCCLTPQASVGDYLKLIEITCETAQGFGPDMLLHEIRIVAAIAVECMQNYGAPKVSDKPRLKMRPRAQF